MKISLFFYRKWPVKMTGKVRIWPRDNSAFWPDIVRWQAVISRPVFIMFLFILFISRAFLKQTPVPIVQLKENPRSGGSVVCDDF
jgi:hypothetical protein